MQDCHYFSWNRSPKWKWQRVLKIINNEEPDTTIEFDSENGYIWIKRAKEFKLSYDRDSNPLNNPELITKYGDIYTAYQIYTDDSTYYKSELEAMVLAGAETEEIATESGVSDKCIKAYEELFYDVREKLTQEAYVIHQLIGIELQDLKSVNRDTIWKVFGYYYGPYALRAIISRTVNPQRCATADTVESALESDTIKSIKIAAAIAAKNPNGGDRKQQNLMATFAMFMEIDKMEDFSKGSDGEQIWDHVKSMMNTFNFSVGNQSLEDGSVDKKSPAARYANSAIDLRTDEMMDLPFTGMAPDAERAVNTKYPPVPKKEKAKG